MTRPVRVDAPTTGYLGYLGDVAAALAPLPTADRDELLETVADHLESIADDAEKAGGAVDRAALIARLGPPRDYARELVAAAGLSLPPRPPTLTLESAAARLTASSAYRSTVAYLVRLVPAWWAVRGYLGGGLLLAIADLPVAGVRYGLLRHWRPGIGEVYGAAAPWAIVLIAALVVASVALGLHGERRTFSGRFWNRVADVGGLLGLILVPTWWLSPMFYAYVVSS